MEGSRSIHCGAELAVGVEGEGGWGCVLSGEKVGACLGGVACVPGVRGFVPR